MTDLDMLTVVTAALASWYSKNYLSRTDDGYVFGFDGQKPMVLTYDDVCSVLEMQTKASIDDVKRYFPLLKREAIAYAVFKHYFMR